MSQDLFRKEALEARHNQRLGGISLAQPIRFHVLTIVAVMIALAVVAFLVFGTYTRRSHVTGQLSPTRGLATVLVPVTGVMGRLDVTEGERVALGQTLALVKVPRHLSSGDDVNTELQRHLDERRASLAASEQAQQRQLDAQAEGLDRQLVAARAELVQLESEVDTRQQQARLASETLDSLRSLQGKGYASDLQIKQQEVIALAATGDAQSLLRQADAIRRAIAQLEQARRELPAQRQATLAAIRQNRAQLDQEQVETSTRGALTVESPVDGVVATQLVKPGQAVQAGQPLLTLLPGDGTLEAELLVPSRAIGFIEPGDRVLLRYQAFPYQRFGHQQGRVVRISRSTINADAHANAYASAQASEPLYRVNVELERQTVTAYGKAEPLKPGMLLDADILGEKRRLIEWLLEPLYSLKGPLADG